MRRGFKEIRAVAAVVESVSSSSDSCMETSTVPQSSLATPSESYVGGPPAGNIPTRNRSGARAATSTVVDPAVTAFQHAALRVACQHAQASAVACQHFSSLVEAGIVQDYFALPPPVFTAPPKTTTAALRATTR